MRLDEYRRKRDLARTNEPVGADPRARTGPTRSGAFVVHLHDATHRHYDLRVEIAGVLASFAVPKGPSLDPAEKRLAMHTEDHPIEYLDFEAVIPDGTYGAGPMIVWDRGQIRYLEDAAEDGIEKGKLDFELTGHKLRGRFALVKLKGNAAHPSTGKEWLFFKKPDAFAKPERDVTKDAPRSILSGLTVDELADAPRIARAIEEEAARLGAPARPFDGRSVSPMLCASEGAKVADPAYLYELKLDGVRIVATKDERGTALHYRRSRDATASYPEVARAVRALAPERVVLDGEIVAFDATGRPSFQRLGRRIHVDSASEVARAMIEVPVAYVAFDLLAIGERDLTGLPLTARKALLAKLLPSVGVARALDHLDGDGRPLLAFCRQHQLEGVVAKRKDAPYRAGPRRTTDWVKMKCERDDEFVVVGMTRGEGVRGRLGALDLATYDGDELVYRGKVGSGLDDATVDRLATRLEALATDRLAAKGKPMSAPRGRVFVRPEVVVSVRFLGYSDDGHVRHPVFRGVRDDKSPRECMGGPAKHEEARSLAKRTEETRSSAPVVRQEPRPRAAVTNRAKILFPEAKITKAELVDYYEAIAPAMCPYLADRPLMMVRYPDGIHGKTFYQWHVPPNVPPFVRTTRLHTDETPGQETEVFVGGDPETLRFVANLAAIPIHVLAGRVGRLDSCDFLTIDFDVEKATLGDGVTLAWTLRELLDEIGLPGFPKTSGQSGLHVFVPLGGVPYPVAVTLAELLGRLLCARHPDIATMERLVKNRGARVYVDTGQTGPGRTIVAPYSVRATPEASVSTPLRWEELGASLDPKTHTIRTVPERVARHGCPMAGLLTETPDVARAVGKLERLVRELSPKRRGR